MKETTGIENILFKCGLDSMVNSFETEGITSISDLKLLTDANLKELGLNIGQRNRLKKCLSLIGTPRRIRRPSKDDGKPDEKKEQSGTIHEPATTENSSSQLTEEHETAYNALFYAIDVRGTGRIQFDEFVAALKKLDLYKSDSRSRRIFGEAIGKEDNDAINREDLISVLKSAENGNKDEEWFCLARADEEVFLKLKQSPVLTFTEADVLNATITDKALDEVQRLDDDSNYQWVSTKDVCRGERSNFVFNLLIVNASLVKKMIRKICISKLDDLEKKMDDMGLNNFVVKYVNIDSVEEAAFDDFEKLCHRYAHTCNLEETDMMRHSTLQEVHSIRKTALLVSANKSVQDVKEAAASYVQHIVKYRKYAGHNFREKAAAFAREVHLGRTSGTIATKVVVGAATAAACSIM